MDSVTNAADTAHQLNAICPYFTMFPLSFPLDVLTDKRRGVVVDPFCGRGTTNLAARLRGRPTVAVDSSPVAIAATAAKLPRGKVCADDVVKLARHLLKNRRNVEIPGGRFWRLAYNQYVLEDLCSIRDGLKIEKTDAARLLRGIILGALHGPLRRDGTSSYFSNQCPRTFGPKPDYAIRFWDKKRLRAPRVDAIEIISARAQRVLSNPVRNVRSRICEGDSRKVSWGKLLGDLGSIDWIVTSPPYYGLKTYRPDQWIREWFLGGSSQVQYTSAQQLRHSSKDAFASDLGVVFSRLVPFCSKKAHLVMRFGSINDRPVDALKLARLALAETGWKIDKVRSAGLASLGKRQVDSFVTSAKPARVEFDIWCSLA